MATKGEKKDVVQVRNPRTGKYVKIDRAKGKIIGHKTMTRLRSHQR